MTELFLYKSVLAAEHGLLEPEELRQLTAEPELPPDLSDEERAQILAYEAWEYVADDPDYPDDACAVAEEALEFDEDCVDAIVCLWSIQDRASDEAYALASRAQAAAETKIENLEQWRRGIDDLWVFSPGTRGFVRAHVALAFTLWERGERYDACGMAEQAIALNPTDNTGMRWHLVNWYLARGATGRAYRLLREYPDEPIGPSLWAAALVEFLRSGPGKKARKALLEAATHNPILMMMVTGDDAPDSAGDFLDSFEPGALSEALVWRHVIREAWKAHPEAMRWLKGMMSSSDFTRLSMTAITSVTDLLAEADGRSSWEILRDLMADDDPDLL